ncbi:MAG: hypothetical protein HY897_22505 [Deltaproteobacteria bacterium]|nr:hypothetical protein [Deltaproteobacteria bacterium]
MIRSSIRTRLITDFSVAILIPSLVTTGLGLSIAYGIVERHGGTIPAEKRAGTGTVMRISMPVGKGAADG